MDSVKERISDYADFVKQNPQKIKRFEEVARMATVLFPVSKLGVYSEVINEALYALLGNLGSIHEHLIHRSDHFSANYLTSINKFQLYVSMVLTFLSNTGVCVEIFLRQFIGKRACRGFILTTEWFRFITKLWILFSQARKSKSVLLLSGGQYNAKKIGDLVHIENNTSEVENQRPAYWIGSRTGKKFILPERLSHLSNRSGNQTQFGGSFECLSNVEKTDRILSVSAELINILRPLITLYYRKWVGWFLSLFLDLLSFRLIFLGHLATIKKSTLPVQTMLLKKLKGQEISYSLQNLNPDLRAEMSRRALLLFLYLLRSPFYEEHTLSWAQRAQASLSFLPLSDKLGNFIEDTLNYYHKAHFYISGS